MPPTELVKALPDDSFLASVLRRKKRSLTETVPPDIDPREALANIKECVTSLNKLGNATSVVGAILGAHMAVVAKRPEIYEAAGYDSLTAFEKAEIIDKVSHGSVYNYKLIAEVFPDTPIEEVLQIGSTNMVRAARTCNSIEASPAQKKKILEKAAEMNTAVFKEDMEKLLGGGKGSTDTDSLTLIGPANEIADLKEDFAEPRFHEFAGSTTPLGMVRAAVDESKSIWPKEPDKPLQTGAEDGWGS